MSDMRRIHTPDGDFAAYVAIPPDAQAGAIVVLQEIFGINADMRKTCDDFAALGYAAICPDLYWRQEPGVELTDQSAGEWAKALALYEAFDVDAGIADVAAAIRVARGMSGANGKVGAVGYCLGGLLSFLTATRTDVDASVVYYGVGIDRYLGEAQRLAHPLLMHIAEEDEFVPKTAQQQIRTALQDHPLVELLRYPGCSHAFARNRGVHYDDASAMRANARTREFFSEHLG